ncbi:MAG: DUF4177 domain-containing protein [Cyanobacteria bacterium K_Offshore_surface_m2_011]|nr:DUF4177 domain-containing protein [Cyanobacteria bacterium K_Offshore_surface_m2_011]
MDPSPYEQAIYDHAALGWDLVQIFAENPAATASEHVLIFRRPA